MLVAVRGGTAPDANVVICIDFIAVIPSFVVAGIGLLSGRRPAGFAAQALLVFSALLGGSIVVGQIAVIVLWGPVAPGPMAFFSVFTAAALVLAIRRSSRTRFSSGRSDRPSGSSG